MKGLRLPQRVRVRSESVPISRLVRVAAMALAATIHEMGRGSGVILSYMKVLKYWFSTPQANCPEKPSRITASQTRRDSLGREAVDGGFHGY